MRRRPMCLLCLLLMAAMCLADGLGIPLIRGIPLPENLQAWVLQHPKSTICGEVVRCVETETSQSVYLKQVYLIYQSEKVSIENVRIFLNRKEMVPAGTLLLVSGMLEEVGEPRNPGEFDSKQYYACQHIYYFMKKAEILKKSHNYSGYEQFLINLRARFANIMETAAKEAAPVFAAIVLGDKTGLDMETKLRYQMAGIIHILAISGLHISILGMGFYQLLKRLGLGIWPAGILALIFMLQYGMMTGGNVSIMRALCMFLLSVGAKILGRIYDPLTALSAAAILILLDSPAYLYSSSFILSFGAVLGILLAVPAAQEIVGVKELRAAGVKKGSVGEESARLRLGTIQAFLSSAIVQLMMLPAMLWFYGEVSAAGVFLNLVILPTVGAVLVSGVGMALLGLFWMNGAAIAAFPGRGLLALYEKLCAFAGKIPFCTWVGGQPKIWQILVYYGLFAAVGLGGVRVKRRWKQEREERVKSDEKLSRKQDLLLGLGCLVLLGVGTAVLGYHPGGKLKITCLDVGQGDGIVVETPDGACFLIDGGSTSKSKTGQYQILPFLKSQGIFWVDGIFVSHTDGDHINGIEQLLELMVENLTTVRAGMLVLPQWEEKPEACQKLEELAEKAGVKVHYAKVGAKMKTGKVTVTLLAPQEDASGRDVNEDGMVLRLNYGDFTALFTGDMGEPTEKKLLDQLSDVDFLKVGHHGSRYSSCEEFLERISPEVGVISCSSTNTYGHPSKETIERLEEVGCQVEYTMKSGAVTVESDGRGMKISRFIKAS